MKVILVEVCNACGYLLLGCMGSRFDETVGYPGSLVKYLIFLPTTLLPRNNQIERSRKEYMTLAQYPEPANATKILMAL